MRIVENWCCWGRAMAESDRGGDEDEAAQEIDRKDGLGRHLAGELDRLADPLVRLDQPGGAVGGKAVDRRAERGFLVEKPAELLLDERVGQVRRRHGFEQAADGVELKLQKGAVMQALPKGTIKGIDG